MTEWSVDRLEARNDGFILGPLGFTIRSGECLVVVGPIGAGKTTLLRSLAGFHPRTQGSFRRGEEEVGALPAHRRGIGYVPQGLGLFPHLTVRDNIAYGARFRSSRPDPAAASVWSGRFGLDELADRHPPELSGGEQQRVALARALASEPELLLWDEPVSQLDVGARDELVTLLQEMLLRDAIPLVLVTHDVDAARSVGDRMLLIESGHERFLGTFRDAVDRPPSAFGARFVGYDNVLTSEQIPRDDRELSRALRARAGAGGVCFGADTVRPATEGGGFSARVLRRSPAPGGTRFLAEVEGLRLVGWAPAGERFPSPVGLDVDVSRMMPIGPAEASSGTT